MIKATELRIGNWVLNPKNGEDHQVSAADIADIDNGLKTREPIPLTEEWLLKFGWVWNKECNSFEKYPNGDTRMNVALRMHGYTMFNYVLKATICERIFYVHQLQNLFCCLCGEELVIK